MPNRDHPEDEPDQRGGGPRRRLGHDRLPRREQLRVHQRRRRGRGSRRRSRSSGYVPNALARQLRSKRTKMLALVVSDISNPFFTTIARGVEDVAERPRLRRDVLQHRRIRRGGVAVPAPARRAPGGRRPPRPRPEAAAVLPAAAHPQHPVRGAGPPRRRADVDSVRCDSEAGAHALARHLVDARPSPDRRPDRPPQHLDVGRSRRRRAPCARARRASPSTSRSSATAASTSASKNRRDGHLMAQEVLTATDEPSDGDLRRQQLHRVRRRCVRCASSA